MHSFILQKQSVVQRCSVKKVFLKIAQSSQVLSCEFCEIFKNTLFIEHVWWLLLILTLFYCLEVMQVSTTCRSMELPKIQFFGGKSQSLIPPIALVSKLIVSQYDFNEF